MKLYINKFFVLIALSLICFSCDLDENDAEITTDLESVEVIVSGEGTEPMFIIGQDIADPTYFSWVNEQVELNFHLSTGRNLEDISQIEFFMNCQEVDGYNYEAPFNDSKILISTVLNEDISSDGDIVLSFTALDLSTLFADKFENTTNGNQTRTVDIPLLEGDLFTITWVISFADGTIFDSSSVVSVNNSHSIQTTIKDVYPPTWNGRFNYEVIEAGAGAAGYGYDIGKTGVIELVETDKVGVYEFTGAGSSGNNGALGWKYGRQGPIHYDYATGASIGTSISSSNGLNYAETWDITYINETTIKIHWVSFYDHVNDSNKDYNGTVYLTRTDGYAWPKNLYGFSGNKE